MFTNKITTSVYKKIMNGVQSVRVMSNIPTFETLSISTPKEFVYQVQLNRPDKLNAFNDQMFQELGKCFRNLDDSPDCRVVILSGAGRAFSSGLDIQHAMSFAPAIAEQSDIARKCRLYEKKIKIYQDAFLSIEQCRKPVIGAIHGLCIGAGFNLICGADIRYCSTNAWFSLKEVDLGLAADIGALQWLPKILGSQSLVRELAFTARKMLSDEALQCGFVNRLFKDDETLFAETLKIAEGIAQKSPVAVQGTKMTIIHARDHGIQDGLDYIRCHNKAMLQSEDFVNSVMAQATKGDRATFSKL